jgi:hypothetical protein
MGAQSSKLEEVSDGLILSVAAREGHVGTLIRDNQGCTALPVRWQQPAALRFAKPCCSDAERITNTWYEALHDPAVVVICVCNNAAVNCAKTATT